MRIWLNTWLSAKVHNLEMFEERNSKASFALQLDLKESRTFETACCDIIDN